MNTLGMIVQFASHLPSDQNSHGSANDLDSVLRANLSQHYTGEHDNVNKLDTPYKRMYSPHRRTNSTGACARDLRTSQHSREAPVLQTLTNVESLALKSQDRCGLDNFLGGGPSHVSSCNSGPEMPTMLTNIPVHRDESTRVASKQASMDLDSSRDKLDLSPTSEEEALRSDSLFITLDDPAVCYDRGILPLVSELTTTSHHDAVFAVSNRKDSLSLFGSDLNVTATSHGDDTQQNSSAHSDPESVSASQNSTKSPATAHDRQQTASVVRGDGTMTVSQGECTDNGAGGESPREDLEWAGSEVSDLIHTVHDVARPSEVRSSPVNYSSKSHRSFAGYCDPANISF